MTIQRFVKLALSWDYQRSEYCDAMEANGIRFAIFYKTPCAQSISLDLSNYHVILLNSLAAETTITLKARSVLAINASMQSKQGSIDVNCSQAFMALGESSQIPETSKMQAANVITEKEVNQEGLKGVTEGFHEGISQMRGDLIVHNLVKAYDLLCNPKKELKILNWEKAFDCFSIPKHKFSIQTRYKQTKCYDRLEVNGSKFAIFHKAIKVPEVSIQLPNHHVLLLGVFAAKQVKIQAKTCIAIQTKVQTPAKEGAIEIACSGNWINLGAEFGSKYQKINANKHFFPEVTQAGITNLKAKFTQGIITKSGDLITACLLDLYDILAGSEEKSLDFDKAFAFFNIPQRKK